MERQPDLSLEDFKLLSQQVSDRIRARVQSKCKSGLLNSQVVYVRKVLNELVLLVCAKDDAEVLAFIVLVRLESFIQKDYLANTVRVHQLFIDVYENPKQYDIPCEPTHLSVGSAEGSFILYGGKHAWIADFPGIINSMGVQAQPLEKPELEADIKLESFLNTELEVI
jgi:hypothetical protein